MPSLSKSNVASRRPSTFSKPDDRLASGGPTNKKQSMKLRRRENIFASQYRKANKRFKLEKQQVNVELDADFERVNLEMKRLNKQRNAVIAARHRLLASDFEHANLMNGLARSLMNGVSNIIMCDPTNYDNANVFNTVFVESVDFKSGTIQFESECQATWDLVKHLFTIESTSTTYDMRGNADCWTIGRCVTNDIGFLGRMDRRFIALYDDTDLILDGRLFDPNNIVSQQDSDDMATATMNLIVIKPVPNVRALISPKLCRNLDKVFGRKIRMWN